MPQIVIYPTADGGVAQLFPVPTEFSGLTIEEVIAKDVPANTPYAVIDPTDATKVPQDEYFRDAWVFQSGVALVDMTKARAIHLARIKSARDAQWAACDDLLQAGMASGASSDMDTWRARRSALMAIDSFDLSTASTPDQLKALWPATLPAQA